MLDSWPFLSVSANTQQFGLCLKRGGTFRRSDTDATAGSSAFNRHCWGRSATAEDTAQA